MTREFVFFLFVVFLKTASAFDSRHVVFVIVSQPEAYHASVAVRLKQDIIEQVEQTEKRSPTVFLSHVDFTVPGAWTITPMLAPLLTKIGDAVRWALFVEAHTAVRCDLLFSALAAADKSPDTMWIGYPLRDDEPTIIHHFALFEELDEQGGFAYPYFASGFAMRTELMSKIVDEVESGKKLLEGDFSIDPAFELARLVYTIKEPMLTPDLSFCVISADECATYPRHYDSCGSAIPEESIFFAVKTWSGFHSTRAKVVKKTWGKLVTNLLFFSDLADETLPAIDIGVPNTKTGHCAKTLAILRHVVKRVKDTPTIKWIFLADDDTILGVERLCEVLSCARGGEHATVLGERYGYGYTKKDTLNKGYDYITGGGGTAFSVGAAARLSRCACGAPDAPDDMTLGACATHRLNVTMTHSPLFHQARPQDYPREYLSRDRPVSFHRHSTHDPTRLYVTWFQHDELTLMKRKSRNEIKDEL